MHERIGKPAHRPNMQTTNHPQTYHIFIETVFFSRRLARSTDRKLPDNRSILTARGTCCYSSTTRHNRFTALFPGPPRWAGARGELLDFMVQEKINRGIHTDRLAWRHSIRTNQYPPPSSMFFTGQMPFLSPNQQCQSTEGNGVKSLNVTQGLTQTSKNHPLASSITAPPTPQRTAPHPL